MRRRLVAAGDSSGDSSSDASSAAVDASSLTTGEICFPASFDVNGYSIAHDVEYVKAAFGTLVRQDDDGHLVDVRVLRE